MSPMQLTRFAATRGALLAGPAVAFGLLATPAQAASTSFASAVLADAPNAWWRMSELPGAGTALKASGHANHGSDSATGIMLGIAGIGGGDTAARFDGLGSGRIVAPNSATSDPANITPDALISGPGPNGFQQRILEKSRFTGGGLPQYGLNILDDRKVRFEIQVGAPNSVIDSVGTVRAGVGIGHQVDRDQPLAAGLTRTRRQGD